MSENKSKTVIGSVYLHVSNSGATFSVVDAGFGPEIHVDTNAFGNLINSTKVITTRESLQALADLFSQAAKAEEYSGEYCHAAELS